MSLCLSFQTGYSEYDDASWQEDIANLAANGDKSTDIKLADDTLTGNNNFTDKNSAHDNSNDNFAHDNSNNNFAHDNSNNNFADFGLRNEFEDDKFADTFVDNFRNSQQADDNSKDNFADDSKDDFSDDGYLRRRNFSHDNFRRNFADYNSRDNFARDADKSADDNHKDNFLDVRNNADYNSQDDFAEDHVRKIFAAHVTHSKNNFAHDNSNDYFADDNFKRPLADDRFKDRLLDDKFTDNIADEEFMRNQAEIQRQRKSALRKTCAKYHPAPPPGPYKVARPKRFIIDEKYKLGYCSVAKVASTNWRLLFETLAGVVQTGDQHVEQADINRKLKHQLTYMSDFDPRDVDKLLDQSLTFMFARDPFSRVLSSYRNKLEPGTTFERARHWQHRVGEMLIMRRYRPGYHSSRTVKEFEQNYDLTFAEFVRFLGDKAMQEIPIFRNIHWAEVYTQCTPCNMDYDVIGKLETINDDVRYILNLAHLEGKVQFLTPINSSPTFSYKNNTLETYFRDVPIEYIRKLYARYKVDFEMFGYELPEFANQKT